MGPSVFTENARRHLMLEINSPEDGSATLNEDDDCKRSLVESYFAAVSFVPTILCDTFPRLLKSCHVIRLSCHSVSFILIDFNVQSTKLIHCLDQRPPRSLLSRRDHNLPRHHQHSK